MNFTVLILGSDANAYYMARCYHELYGKKVDMMSKGRIAVTTYSSIINFTEVDGIYDKETFILTLSAYAQKSNYEKILLVGTNDKYVRLIVENQDRLDTKFVHNYPSLDLMDTMLVKDKFYSAFQGSFQGMLGLPKTFIYSCTEKPKIADDFTYPVILKPGNGIEYHDHHFNGMSKVYKIQSYASLLDTIKKIEDSGYTDNLVIQEFIPGDDCALFDAVFYSGKDKKVKLMTFAEIGLQERTPTGVGNCTVLVNGFDEHGYKESLVYAMKDFLEKIGFQGFCEFDLKYDSRDGKYKVFEINPRQARSSYYLAACGHNLMKYLIDDVIYGKEIPVTLMKNELALSFVPKIVVRKYVTSVPLRAKIESLIKTGKYVRPLHYAKDSGIKRKMYLLLRDINYIIKYRKLSW